MMPATPTSYVNLDAGVWLPNRSATGELVEDAAKFPSGIASLATKLHGMRLRFVACTQT